MINIAIVGAAGYSGIELIKILANHPHADIKYITSRSYNTQKLGDLLPQ